MPLSPTLKLGAPPRRALSLWYKSTSYLLNNVAPSLIHDYTGQQFYDSVAGIMSFPFTSTRTTNATQFDQSGHLVFAPANLIVNSVSFSTWSNNGATVTAGVISGPFAENADKIVESVSTGGHGRYLDPVPSIQNLPGVPFTYSIYAKAGERQYLEIANNIGNVVFDLIAGVRLSSTGPTTTYNIVNVGNGWYRCEMRQTPTTLANSSFYVSMRTTAGAGSYTGDGKSGIYVYGAQLEYQPIASSFMRTSGSAYYGPRFDYDPVTLSPRGVLIEESRTNLCPLSADSGTITGIASIAGSLSVGSSMLGINAMTFTADGTSAQHYTYAGSLVSAPPVSTVVTISCFVRAGTATRVQFRGSGNWCDSANCYINVNLSTKAVTASGIGVLTSGVIDCGGRVLRIYLSLTTAASTSSGAAGVLSIISSDTAVMNEANALNTSIDHRGWQFEVGAFPTSLIPTFGTSATRSGDNLKMAVGAWLDSKKGTIYSDFIRAYVSSGSGTSTVFARLYTDANNALFMTSGSGTHSQHRFDTINGGVTQAQISTSIGGMQMTRRKLAGLYNTNLFKACENGAIGTDDTAGTIPTVTSLNIGCAGSTNQINGWMREFRYYPDASASSVQLQNLTT